MEIADFKAKLSTPGAIDFEDTMAIVEEHYIYQPTAFSNGVEDAQFKNEAGQNEGSCKVFAFAHLNGFTQDETLLCFGRFYQDVLNTPEGNDHANIRTFMKFGWEGIQFFGTPLEPRGKRFG
jgi:hypothetical protein